MQNAERLTELANYVTNQSFPDTTHNSASLRKATISKITLYWQ